MIWLIFLCVILAVALGIAAAYILSLRRSARELREGLSEKLLEDTNTLLDISTSDDEMRHLAADLNAQLRLLRADRQRYLQGDHELKEAVTNISHDLRTPLTAICGYLELLDREETSETVRRYLGLIQNRTEAMKRLTEELFRYSVITSTPQALEMATLDLGSVLEESIAGFYAALTRRGITPEIDLPEETVFCRADRAALARVFSNILNNSLKYSDGDLRITLSKTGEVHFSNTASTLDEVQVGRLFDRFFTVEAARNSTGLGLAISKTLVEQMGGEISAAYDNGVFCVRVQLPK